MRVAKISDDEDLRSGLTDVVCPLDDDQREIVFERERPGELGGAFEDGVNQALAGLVSNDLLQSLKTEHLGVGVSCFDHAVGIQYDDLSGLECLPVVRVFHLGLAAEWKPG